MLNFVKKTVTVQVSPVLLKYITRLIPRQSPSLIVGRHTVDKRIYQLTHPERLLNTYHVPYS